MFSAEDLNSLGPVHIVIEICPPRSIDRHRIYTVSASIRGVGQRHMDLQHVPEEYVRDGPRRGLMALKAAIAEACGAALDKVSEIATYECPCGRKYRPGGLPEGGWRQLPAKGC